MSEVNWKQKYQAIKSQYMEAVDAAFRLGYEQGQQEAQLQQMQQQQQQEAEMAAAQSGMGQDPNAQPGEEQQDPNAAPADSANPAGSELDQHISQLESMLGKGEIPMEDLVKSITGLRQVQKKVALNNELKKSAMAIPEIAKALNKPKFKIGVNASHNMSQNAKAAVSMQEEILQKVMSTWKEEESRTGNDILSVLQSEGLTNKGE